MRTPKLGDVYQVCVHLVDEAAAAAAAGKHYWRLPQKRWLMLCAACHARYAERTAVHVEGHLRRFKSTPDLGSSGTDAVHVATRSSPRCILSPENAQGSRPPQPLPTDDFTLLKLWLSVQELTTSMFLPSRSWSLAAVRRQTRTLRANYQRQRQAHEQRGPGMPSLLSTLSEIDTALAHIEQRLRIVLRAGR